MGKSELHFRKVYSTKKVFLSQIKDINTLYVF